MPADWGDHGDTVLLFFGLWREERRSIRPLVSGPATDKKNKRPRVSPLVFNDFSAGCLKFFQPILRVRNKGIVT